MGMIKDMVTPTLNITLCSNVVVDYVIIIVAIIKEGRQFPLNNTPTPSRDTRPHPENY